MLSEGYSKLCAKQSFVCSELRTELNLWNRLLNAKQEKERKRGFFMRWKAAKHEEKLSKQLAEKILVNHWATSLSRAWCRWTEFVDERARAKVVCSKVLRRMQNLQLAGVFDGWVSTARRRRRQKAVVGRVIARLQSGALCLSFARWLEAARDIREQRLRCVDLSKAQRIRSALFARGSRICCLVLRSVYFSLKLGCFRRWRSAAVLLSLRVVFRKRRLFSVFTMWRLMLSELRLESAVLRTGRTNIAKSFVFMKAWR
jgi:hypothetical protein